MTKARQRKGQHYITSADGLWVLNQTLNPILQLCYFKKFNKITSFDSHATLNDYKNH